MPGSKIGEAYVNIIAKTQPLIKGIDEAERKTRSATQRMQKNWNRVGVGIQKLSSTARWGFLGMSAVIGGTVYAAAKYEKQMANVSTMLSGKSMPAMKKYKDMVGKMSVAFGESTETLSKGLYDILSASIAPSKALGVLAVSAKAAAAGITNTGVAADAITTIINSYGYAAEDASMVSDKLFAIIKRGKTTFAELGPNIGKVSALAAQAGLGFDDLGASIATMTRTGIRTEMTMTAISGILRVFIKPTDEAKIAAREFGLELDVNTLKTEGMVGVLKKLNGATAEQLALIFPEIEGLKGLAAAIGDATGYMEDYELITHSAGLTQEAFTKQTNTLMFHFNQLKEAGKYLAVQLGEIFTPTIGKAIQNLASWVYKLGENIRSLTDKQKNLLAKMTLLGTAVLGAIGALGLFSTVAGVVAAAGSVIMGVLGLILSPIGLLIVAIAALAAAWVLEWDKIKEITSKLIEIIIMPVIKWGSKKLDSIADWIRVEKLGMEKDANEEFDRADLVVIAKFVADLVWKGMKHLGEEIDRLADWCRKQMGLPVDTNEIFDWEDFKVIARFVGDLVWKGMKAMGKAIDDLALWIQEQMGIPEEARKGIWELTDITAVMGFLLDLVWKGIKNVTGTIKDWVIKNAKLDKPIDELVAKVAGFVIELPDPAKWSFKIGFRVFEYATLGYGIAMIVKGLVSLIKIPAISGGLLPLLFTIGIALIGIDVLGAKLREKLDEAKIDELLTKFSEEHPTLFKMCVAIKELTGLEADLILAYIDKEWPSIQDKIGLVALQIQIPLKIIFDIDLRVWFGEFWKDFTEDLKDTWNNITWPYLSWENFTTSLKEAWANTDWDWFGIKAAGDILISIGKGFAVIGTTIWDLMLTVWEGGLPATIEKIKGMVEQLTAPIPVTLEKAAKDFDVDMLYLASIRMCERGGKGVEMGIKVYSQKFKDELKKMYPDIAEGTKEWQILAAAKSTEFYWKEFKKKFGYSADLTLKDASKEIREKFIEYMGKGFAPASAHVLNQYWIPNMKKWFPELEKLMKEGGHKTIGALIKAIKEKSKKGVKLTEFEKALIKYLDVIETKASKKGSKVGETIGEAIIKGTSPGGISGGIKYSMPVAIKEMENWLGKMLNTAQGIADKFGELFKPALDAMKKMFKKVLPYLPKPMQDAIKGLMKTIDELVDTVGKLGSAFKKPFEEGEKAVKKWVAEIEFSTNIAQFISKRYRQQELWYWAKFYNDVLQIEVESLEDMEEILANLPPEVKEQLEILLKLWKESKDSIEQTWKDMFDSIKSAFSDFSMTVLTMTTSVGEAFQTLGKTIYSAIVKFAIDSIATALTKKLVEAFKIATEAGKAFAAVVGNALVALGIAILNVVFRIRQAQEHWETAWGTIGRSLWFTNIQVGELGKHLEETNSLLYPLTEAGMEFGDVINYLGTQFERFGLAASKSIEEAQFKLEGLHTSMAELGASTTEKLINELDKYYDYRVLKEMSLEELLALSAETRVGIETGTIQEVEESEAEQEARRKDRAISRLQQIEDQYAKEDELMRRKIALTEIEIKLLELKAEREAHRHSERAKQLEEELGLMLEAYHESVEAYEEAEERKQEATEDTTKVIEKETEKQAKAVKDAAEGEAGDVEGATEDMAGSWEELTREMQEEARRMKEAGQTSTEDIRKFIALSTEKMAQYWGQLTGSMITDLGKIPRRIDFDIVGKLHLPEIPGIATHYFDIIGRYQAPSIPSAQIGIPNVPYTMPVIVHPREAILNPPQAREWRAGKTQGGKGDIIFQRGAIRITHHGNITTEMDEERFMRKIADRVANTMRRP